MERHGLFGDAINTLAFNGYLKHKHNETGMKYFHHHHHSGKGRFGGVLNGADSLSILIGEHGSSFRCWRRCKYFWLRCCT